MPKKVTTVDFIDRAIKVHGCKYIYDKVEYVNAKTKVCIICPEHGEFWQVPPSHLSGKGCPQCGNKVIGRKLSDNREKFIQKAKKIHGDKYDYSQAEYVNNYTPLKIICKIHGEFYQTAHTHLNGGGCPLCVGNVKSNTAEFIKKAREIHGDKYDYSKVDYVNAKTKVCIICPEHGEFWQTPNNHLRKQECPVCSKSKVGLNNRLTLEQFKEKATEVHKGKYNYDNVEYVNYDTKIKVICPNHGEFWQSPDAHLHGAGCPMCTHGVSNTEKEINTFINDELKIDTIVRNRTLLDGLECDIIVPSKQLIFEYNGLFWHTENQGKDKNYHLHKTELAESKGYHLIHIFEDEWLEHKDLVLNKIKHILGHNDNKPIIGARKCVIRPIAKTIAEQFLNTYHLQGFVGSTVYYGAFYKDELVGVMTFKQEKEGIWNLTRFATDTGYRLPGLASKIFKHFTENNTPKEVKTFLDRRWSYSDCNVYDKIGFKMESILPPDYRYVDKYKRVHKFNFRKQILHKKYGLPLSMTEREMTDQLGFYRIWDCGLYKYVWRKDED